MRDRSQARRGHAWRIALLVLVCGLGVGTAPSSAADKRLAALAPTYRQWLADVALILRPPEKKAFLDLKEDYQRDGFIRQFWRSRDPYPETPYNEFKNLWYARLEEAKMRFGSTTEDRARTFMLHGEATKVHKTDCHLTFWPLEIWYYERSARLPSGFFLIFYQPAGGGPFVLWRPVDGYHVLQALFNKTGFNFDDAYAFDKLIDEQCAGDDKILLVAIRSVRSEEQFGTMASVDYPPPPRDTEWLATFKNASTDLPPDEDAAKTPGPSGRLTLAFPEPQGNRTLVQGVVQMARDSLALEPTGPGAYSLLMLGEILKDGALFEGFRYRFDLPGPGDPAAGSEGSGDTLPLVFERLLRPGDYSLVLRVEDLVTHRSYREVRPFTVPALAATTGAGRAPEVASALAEVRTEMAGGAPDTDPIPAAGGLRLVPPPGESATGSVRLAARLSGAALRAIHKVAFSLDGKLLLTKAAAPWSVDLALGALPTPHTVRAVGLDAAGREVASDELVLNAAPQRFAVRLTAPRRGERHERGGETLPMRAEIRVPDGQALNRLELYLDERRVATLFQAPFSLPVTLPRPPPRYLRAVAYLEDGEVAEDLVLLNSPGYQENVDVPLVELYAGVKDAQGRPLLDLQPADFHVLDGGVPQEVLRVERVTDRPVSVALLIDTSASMVKSLGEAQRAAIGFLQASLAPRDRVALIPFNDSPRLAVKLTNDLAVLVGAVAGLQAERGTVLWDSLVFGLHYLQGGHGQRALLLLTDGGDRSSHFSFDETLEYARRSGVAIYTVGLHVGRLDVDIRHALSRLAAETGGRSFFPDRAEDLVGIYRQINEELRARYLVVYQPKNPPAPGEYRPVVLQVDRPGATVETLHGYYP